MQVKGSDLIGSNELGNDWHYHADAMIQYLQNGREGKGRGKGSGRRKGTDQVLRSTQEMTD